MTERELRLWGDPFQNGPAAATLRGLLQSAETAGWRVGLCLTGVVGATEGRPIELYNGSTRWTLRTAIGDAELAACLRAADTPVAASAPVVVCGDADQVALVRLEWPEIPR